MATESRALSVLEDKLDRAKAQLATSRERLREGQLVLMESVEVSGGALAAGFFRGRFPGKADLGPNKAIPIELLMYGAAQILAHNDKANEAHYRRVGNGALAGYTYFKAMEWGQELAKKAAANPQLTK